MKQARHIKQNTRSGQAMLIAVLSLGGAILGATTVAGLLTLYQIRATTDSANSAKAIFAADAGVEYALFNHYCVGAGRCPGDGNGTDYPLPTFVTAGGATPVLTINCYTSTDGSTGQTTCTDPAVQSAISSGIANGSERAFFLGLAGQTIYP